MIKNLSPLFMAVKHSEIAIVKYLLDECGASVKCKVGWSVPSYDSLQ